MGEIEAYITKEPTYSIESLVDSRAQIQKSLINELMRVHACVMPSDVVSLAVLDNCLTLYSDLKQRPEEEFNWVSGRIVAVLKLIGSTLTLMGIAGNVRGPVAPEKSSAFASF